jgi:NADH-quinone oxidoreductase subunit E
MKPAYKEIILKSKEESGTLLDALHALQVVEGYVTPDAIDVLAEEFNRTSAEIYDSASFYSMFRFTPPCTVTIQVCRSAPCHVAGATEVIKALEASAGVCMDEATADGKYKLEYTECLGQCQSSPSLLVNGVLYTKMDAQKTYALFEKKGGIGA